MTSELAMRPLVRWDGFALRVDLDMVELVVNRALDAKQAVIRRILIDGEAETLRLHVSAEWKGFPAQLSARVSELRLYRRYLGCRLEGLQGPLGLPLPLGMAAALTRKYGNGTVDFDADDRILLVDLRRYLPEGLEVRVESVHCRDRWLVLGLAGGSVASVLASRDPGLGT